MKMPLAPFFSFFSSRPNSKIMYAAFVSTSVLRWYVITAPKLYRCKHRIKIKKSSGEAQWTE